MVKQQAHHNVGTCLWHVSPQAAMPPHTQSVRFPTHKKISEIREICVSQRNTKPTQSVRFPTHKKISEIREICVSQRNTKPHTIREIYHPQKNQ